MNMNRIFSVPVLLLTVLSVSAQAPVDSVSTILGQAQIKPSDTILNRTSKLLMVINETETLWSNSKGDSSQYSPEYQYELDSKRSVTQMCDQKVGGSCGTMGRVFAELLIRSGIPNDNIRIVSAASEPDLRMLCEGRSGQAFNPGYAGPPPAGHVFVLVKDGDQWRLINTTQPLLHESARVGKKMDFADFAPPNKGANFKKLQELALKKGKASLQEKLALASRLEWSDIESTVWKSPEDIEKSLNGKDPLAMPSFPSLPKTFFDKDPSGKIHENRFQPMYAFNIFKPSEYPQHVAEERKGLVASGTKGKNICRSSMDLKNLKAVVPGMIDPKHSP